MDNYRLYYQLILELTESTRIATFIAKNANYSPYALAASDKRIKEIFSLARELRIYLDDTIERQDKARPKQ